MNKDKIKREDLKHNFLKNIIIRFDYTGVSEAELDGIIAKVKPIFKSAGYSNMREEYLTEMDFELQDPERLEEEGLPVKDIRKSKAYVFSDPESGINCKLSSRFAFIQVRNSRYVSFSEYSTILMNVVAEIKKDVDFMELVRFGIRKINGCILKDINDLSKYFEKNYFPIHGFYGNHKQKLFESKDCYVDEDHNVNLMKTLLNGEYDDQIAYQVILDTDIYMKNDNNINQLFDNEKMILSMNEKLFALYKEALTDTFLELLCCEKFEDTGIIGVDINGE